MEFYTPYIVKFDSVREIYSIIKFSFELFSLANSSMRLPGLPLQIQCSPLLREIRRDDLCIYSQFILHLNPVLLYVRKCVCVCVFLLIPKSHCVRRKQQGRVAKAPDQACGWVAWIHKSGSSVNLSQVLESQPSVNMLPQDRMGFKGFLSPKRNQAGASEVS